MRIVKAAASALALLGSLGAPGHAQDAAADKEPTPIIRGFEAFPFPVRVPRGLFEMEPVGDPFEYDRTLPFLGKEAAEKGIVLPEPLGVSLLGVYNIQDSAISDLSVALSFVGAPPADTPLVSTPFVTFDDVVSETESYQLKLDAWVLPFLNAFVTRGRVRGGSDINVAIDVDDFIGSFPVPIPPGLNPCSPVPCGSVEFPFTARIDADTYTFGLVGVRNWGKNLLTLNGAYTFSDSRKATSESVIRVGSVGARYGRLVVFDNGITITPYVGINYTHSDNIIRGTTSTPDGLLPNGETLYVRFEARQQNILNWSGSAGFAMAINRKWNVNIDLTANEHLKRAVLGATYRF
jgi:hypothetical protein